MKTISLFVLFLILGFLKSQDLNYPVFTVPNELKENANACVRLHEITIDVVSRNTLVKKTHRVLTVFNKYGETHHENYAHYNNVSKVKKIEAVVYDAGGKEIKKFKKKDFKDSSVGDGIGSISDTRVLVLEYTPTQYPYTIEFTSEVETDNTAFIPQWYPLDNYYLSVENAKYLIQFPSELGFKYKESNFDFFPITKEESSGILKYETKNVAAIKREEYAPSFRKFLPNVIFSLNKFHLEGVNGEAETWDSFGKWMYGSLIVGTEELSEETKEKIRAYTNDVDDPIEKSKKVFQYVQDNTRYVSIQLGIGGWKPMKVKDVDRLGYGDCKALTNYTRSLLKAVNIDSYYALIYLDRDKINIDEDFVSIQGNHATLAIPNGDSLYWAECTSQTEPFNYQALSTDDRNALLINENGGKIVRTNIYKPEDNIQITKGKANLAVDGSIVFGITRNSEGTQYAFKSYLTTETELEKKNHYKNEFNYINNLTVENSNLNNNKESIVFNETLSFNATNYAQKTGGRIIFPVNITNRIAKIPAKNKDRKAPFEIARGYYDEDEIEIEFPDGYTIEAKSDDVEIITTFGHYKTTCKTTAKGLIYKRTYLLKNGMYSKEDYEAFRSFIEQVVLNDQAKIVINKA